MFRQYSPVLALPRRKQRVQRGNVRLADRVFRLGAQGAGITILAALAGVTLFLIVRSIPALRAAEGELPNNAANFWAYVWPLVFGTVWSSLIGLAIATPFAIGIALFVSHYAPKKLAHLFGYTIDLLAAVPSVVFGLWGITVLAPFVQPFYAWLTRSFGWIPLFSGPVSGTGRTILTASIVLAVMVLPIMTALCREIFQQTPKSHEEAALGLGRALGETMAVAVVLSPAVVVNFFLVRSQNPNTIAANIALQFPEASGLGINTLLATGLVLFAVTIAINMLA